MQELVCFFCQTKIPLLGKVGFREECPKCKRDLHSCKHCKFHDVNVANECLETQADFVRDREKGNYCDYFQPRVGGGAGGPTKDDLMSAAESLFKKS